MPDLFATPTQTDRDSDLFEAAYDFECTECFRPVYEGEPAGYLRDQLHCERCWRDGMKL